MNKQYNNELDRAMASQIILQLLVASTLFNILSCPWYVDAQNQEDVQPLILRPSIFEKPLERDKIQTFNAQGWEKIEIFQKSQDLKTLRLHPSNLQI